MASELQIARASGHSLLGFAAVAQAEGRLPEARHLVAEATSISEDLRDRRYLGLESYMRGLIARDEGELDGATGGFRQALYYAVKGDDHLLVIRALEGLARLDSEHGHLVRAATLVAAAASRREALPWPVAPVDEKWHETLVSTLRCGLDRTSFDRAWGHGWAMATEEVVRVAGGQSSASR